MRKIDGMKRLLVFLLAFSMVLSCVPVPVLAAEGDACAVTPECTGVYVEGVCSVCGEEEPALNHTHVYDGEAVYTQKDETVHTVTRACTTCEEKPTETVDEPHTYVEGVCACGKVEPVPVDEAVEAVKAQIAALPTLEAIQTKPIEEQGEDVVQVNAAYDAYCALTADQQAQLPHAEAVFKPYFDYFNSLTEETAVYSGTCGTNVTWQFSPSTGKLAINGNGTMGFNNDNNEAPWYAYREQIKTVDIGAGVSSIADSAFYNCTNITSVTIANSVTHIGAHSFEYCSGLANITIPDNVIQISKYAFYGCSKLNDIAIPNHVSFIGEQAFGFCDSLTSITIPDGITRIREKTFYHCKNLANITIPDSVTKVDSYAFSLCSNLTDVYYGGTAAKWQTVTIEEYNEPLKKATMHFKETIGGTFANTLTWEFDETTGTLTISGTGAIPNSALPWEAYKDQIKSIVIGDGIEKIYQSAFSNYTNLTSVSLPDTMVIIGKSAFSGCSSLTSITIPTSVTTIGDSAFAGTGLTSVEYEGVKCPSGSNSVFPATVTQVTVPNRYDGTTFCGVNVKCAHPDCTPGNHTWEHGARDDDCFVSFNMKGHGEAIADKRVPKDGNTEAPTAPVAAGYAFGGWYTDEACTNAFDFATSITANITLYAKWTEAEASWYVGETLTGSGTFGQAVAAVNGGSGVTKIQLFKNVDCNGAYFVAGTTVTLELNGKTITRKSEYIGVKNNLTIQDSSSEKTGTIDSIVDEYDACMVVTDNGHLTIQSGNYKNGGTAGAVFIDSTASCTINDGVFTVGYYQILNKGTLDIYGGSFEPTTQSFSIQVASGTTTIYDATFNTIGLPVIGYVGGKLIFKSVPANTRLKNPTSFEISAPDIELPDGYIIKDWDGEEANELLPDGTLPSGKIYTIDKKVSTYTVTVTNDGNGKGTATPDSGTEGTEVTLNATPNSGYQFKEWQVVSGGVTIADNKFIMPASDVEIKAIFEADAPATQIEAKWGTSASALTGSGTLVEAIAAAVAGNASYIKLQNNVVTEAGFVISGGTFVFDLNGHTLSSETANILLQIQDASISIVDSSESRTGSISTTAANYYVGSARVPTYAVYVLRSDVTINNVSVTAGVDGREDSGSAVYVGSSAELTVTGGTTLWGYGNCGGINNANGTVDIQDGNIDFVNCHYGILTVSGNPEVEGIYIGRKCTIHGGTFTGEIAVRDNFADVQIYNGTFKERLLHESGSVSLSGGTYEKGLTVADGTIAKLLADGYCYADINTGKKLEQYAEASNQTQPCKVVLLPKIYTITFSAMENGTASATPASGVAGTEITLTATPNSGYKFKEWQVISGGVTVANNKFTIGTSDVEVKAIFEKDTPETPSEPTAYNINIDSGITGGTVVADKAKAAAGETVILTVTPANGYTLDTLKVNNEAVTVANNKYTLTMPAGDVTVTAIFKSVFTPVAEVTAAGTTTQYASLETALEEAAEFSDGATVKLLQNIPNQNEAIVVTGGKITLNLNGKTITDTMTSAEQCYVLQFTGGTHTIQGGTIVGAVQTYGESKVTFASGTITSGQKFTVMAEGNSTLQVSGGTISNTRTQNGSGVALAAASNSKVVTKGSINAIYMALHAAGASEVSVSGGSLTGGTAGIYVDGDSQVAISDGSVSSPQGRAIWTFGGATSVTGGTFSSSLDVRKTDGTVTLSGGTFMGGIKVESAMLKDILADGCNYYLNDQIVNITADQTEITGGDVVVKRSLTGVSLDKTSLNLVVGQKEKLNATVSPDLATNKKLIWISGDETVATVDEAGEVTAKGAGETTITVTTEDGNFTASCKVEVVAEYPVWVAGTRVTSENMDNVLGDGTVSYDPIAKKLTLSGDIRCDKESTTAIATTYGAGVTLTIAGSGTISASSGSGIYTNKANVKLTGGPFTINGTSYGIYLGEGDLFVDGAKVKATTNDTTKNGVLTYTGVEIMENDGGLLAVTGTKAVVRGSYTMDVETFEELWVAQGAALTISSGETVEVKDKINSSGTIKINGTLKVPAGSGRKTMSGGILYIGTKGYKWDEMAKVYRCLEHDWTYRLKTGTTDTVEAYCEECQSTSSDVLTISKPTREVYNDQGNGNASLNDYSAPVFTNVGEIRYQEKGGGTAIERPLTDAGTYIASVTVGSGENTVTASVEYTIAPRPVTLRVTLKTNSKVYDGTTTAEVDTVTPEGVIRADKEVVVQYGAANYNSPNVADATEVRFTGWGLTGNRSENYVLSAQPASVSATITAKSLKDVQATLSDNVIFNGQPVPELTVKDGDTTLEKDKDYTVSQTGSNGEFTMTITGMGNYQDVAIDKPTYLVVTLPDPDKVEPDDKSAIDAYDRYVEWNQKYQDAELKKALEELLKALTDYDVIKGHKSSYTRGSSKKVSFTANGYFGKFVELKVDGKTLDPKCYTAKSGSTIVTFKNSYLNSLSDGKHDVRFVYVDGSTDGDDYFRIATNNGSPFTGDDNHLLMMTGIMMTSLMCIVIMVMCVPRKKGKYQR